MLAVKGDTSIDPLPTATPASLNFGIVSTVDQVTITNSGMGSLAVTDVTINPASAQNWLSITADTVDTSGLGTYLVSVNRSDVADNTYSATIVFSTSAGPVNVPVLMQKLTNGLSDSAGFHYILAVDAKTSEIVVTTTAEAVDGQYSYELIEVPAGEYLIFAGTNFDNDDTICDDGEACGAYLSLDQPTPVVVDSNRNNIDFVTGLNPSVDPGVLNRIELNIPARRWPNLN